jgi:hypothetical protein
MGESNGAGRKIVNSGWSRFWACVATITGCVLAVTFLSGCTINWAQLIADSVQPVIEREGALRKYKGKFYAVVYYTTSGTPIENVYEWADSKLERPLSKDSAEFKDISLDAQRDATFDNHIRSYYDPVLNRFAPDGPQILSLFTPRRTGVADRTQLTYFATSAGAWLRTYDPAQGKFLKKAQFSCNGGLENHVAFEIAPDGRSGAMLTLSPQTQRFCVAIFDTSTLAITGKVMIPDGNTARQIVISPDGTTAYVNTDSVIRGQVTPSIVFTIDLQQKAMGPSVTINETRLDQMAMTPDGSRLFLSYSGLVDRIVVLDLATLQPSTFRIPPLPPLAQGQSPRYCDSRYVAMHPNGTKLYMVGAARTGNASLGIPGTSLCIFDASKLNLISMTYPFRDEGVIGFAAGAPVFSPGGRYLTLQGGPTEVLNLDTANDEILARLPLPKPNGIGGRVSMFYVLD